MLRAVGLRVLCWRLLGAKHRLQSIVTLLPSLIVNAVFLTVMVTPAADNMTPPLVIPFYIRGV
jgi:hypothetical protein